MLGLEIMACMVGCKKDDNILESEPKEHQTPTEGSVMYSEILKDGEIIEQSIDSIVNFGNDANPAYFFVNLSHTVNGIEVPDNHRDNCAFFTTSRKELEDFIQLYAQDQSLSVGETLTNEEKANAFKHLYDFIKENNIDATEFVYKTLKNPNILPTTLASGSVEPIDDSSSLKPIKPIYPFDPNNIPDDIRPLITRVGSHHEDAVIDSLLRYVVLLEDALDIPFSITYDDSPDDITKIDKLNLSHFVSYLNVISLNEEEYYATEYFDSPKYTCRYGTKNNPMVYCEFYVHGWYKSKRLEDKKPILYMPYLKTLIVDAHIGATMRLSGETEYYNPDIRKTDNNEYAVVGSGQVRIEYGDSFLVCRKALLCFRVDGEKGFEK